MSEVVGVIRFTNKYCYLVFFLSACQFVKEHFEHKAQKEQFFQRMVVFEFSNSNLLSESILSNGGVKRDRTADLLRARQALSQLSYNPIWDIGSFRFRRGTLNRSILKVCEV